MLWIASVLQIHIARTRECLLPFMKPEEQASALLHFYPSLMF